MVAAGHSTQEIADARCVERETVRAQLKSIYGKAGFSSRKQLVRVLLSGAPGFSQPRA